MRYTLPFLIGLLGAFAGVVGSILYAAPVLLPVPVEQRNFLSAATNDRYQDYIMCTGAVAVTPRAPTDGVWILDYRTGKLLGTVIDRTIGKINGFAEVDLVTEFGILPKKDVHFMMLTGSIAQGQAALYVAEVSTGKFGVYTMGPAPGGKGVSILRHDQTTFRQNP